MKMKWDLLIKGGRLIDRAAGVDGVRDVAFAAGKVAAVGENFSSAQARETIDATGKIVVPGLIDLHVHVFDGVGHYCTEADPYCVARGATTVVDTGSAGADIFRGFRKYVIDRADTRVYAYLNISSQGLMTPGIGELMIPELADVERACAMAEEHRDVIIGIKVRLTRNAIVCEAAGLKPLFQAREASDRLGVPLMVHPQDAWCDSIDDILAVFRKGDVLTHCYHGYPCGILDDAGKVRQSVRDAIARGVVFDVGHGVGSFKWEVAEQAIAQGVIATTISTDLHKYNTHGPVFDLVTTASKFLHLGLSVEDVIDKITAAPAAAIGMTGKLGTLAPCAEGDAVILEVRTGSFRYEDTHGGVRNGNLKLEPIAVVRAGRIYRESS
jgi:dihydroorotase